MQGMLLILEASERTTDLLNLQLTKSQKTDRQIDVFEFNSTPENEQIMSSPSYRSLLSGLQVDLSIWVELWAYYSIGERHALYRRLWLHPKIHLVFASKNSYSDVSQALDPPQML
ncbi:hypothetical protein MUK42_04039 [Musa troglodytarum]|uniref:Uncharacterized protein n=1 Tax=Musa troglodytarum TaxID=320322 RepID=A0A9E7GFH7_9LILI|nr:hypothetical protein MUK42_04039 [Musa troglodytarum]